MNAEVLAAFELHMRTAKLSEVTVSDRLEVVRRLADFLDPVALLNARATDLLRWQQQFTGLKPASVDIYTRHVRAFYRWAVTYGHIAADPSGRMVQVRLRKGLPHPISEPDLRLVLACAVPPLRLAYVLAAFAGLRCGEIARLCAEDLDLDAAQPLALIRGKGDRERKIPLLPPVVAELRDTLDGRRFGPIVTDSDGQSITADILSNRSTRFMQAIGVRSTLHSLRHYYATQVVRITKDVLLVRDLLGHASLTTTQIYMQSHLDDAGDRLASLAERAAAMIGNS